MGKEGEGKGDEAPQLKFLPTPLDHDLTAIYRNVKIVIIIIITLYTSKTFLQSASSERLE